ncbi:Membrane alanyl aminopeptidase Metallo peptidase. MEROPS family M01 [Sphingomonas gellani]|uniref:Aminopeptidase N n=1 Tax=Sphingomonas gellani TaxID=1166340 RepID=A0A1H8DA91_9SPHN|nr:M1 family aminopeptidase [Sphingomonas gellani]SEN04159.1 Membrane alanyl aminopeptidase Metallo peptidase. MEROPS family M01 [Sphingomonas gellani]
MSVDPAGGPGAATRRGVLVGAAAIGASGLAATTSPPSFAATPLPSDLSGSGVSLALARRRAMQIAKVRYDLALDVTAPDAATGSVGIAFDRRVRSGDLLLDFRGPTLSDVMVNGRAVPDRRLDGHLVLPERLLKAGENTVSARFTTPIAASGAAIIRFHDEKDGSTYLYTLLVPSDANLLFPCFDQPDLKAQFRWRVTAPGDWTVIANGGVASKEGVSAAVRWTFAQTQPISTYLAAFAAGPWASWASEPAGGRAITLYARASRKAEVDADAQIAANREAVRWLENWFGVPFPFAKLDLVLAPAFPFGGMEHVGAVFYNEDRFVFREPPTLPQRLGRDATIYHEISHQWFGDFVTMRWFDDLWLKEGFSTYMAARIQAELQPDSNAWTTFLLSTKTPAYRADATSGTQPLWQTLDNLDAAKSNYGPIVYNKAPAVLKQLAFLVGEDGFRRGLHLFLERHAYGNATWQDLLGAIAETSKVDLTTFGRQYMLRAGLPRIDTHMTIADGRIASLQLSQRPARALPGDPGGAWPMKVRVRLGYGGRPDVVLDAAFDGETASVANAAGLPVPDYVWANDEDQGYGLFMPDDRTLAWNGVHVGEVRDALLRAMLWSGMWDTVRDRRLAPERYLGILLDHLPAETDEQISRTILARGATALDLYLTAERAAPLRQRWEAALIARMDDARLGYGLRKDAADRLIATARTPLALDRLRALLAGTATLAGDPIRQPTRWAAVRRLVTVGAPDAEALFAAEQRADRSTEAGKDAFVAHAATPTAAIKAEYFRRYFDDAGLNEAWASESLGAFNAAEQATLTLPFLRPALDRLEWIRRNRRIFFLPAWIDAFIGGQTSAQALGVVDAFLAAHPALPIDVRRKILLSRDELDLTVRIREAKR